MYFKPAITSCVYLFNRSILCSNTQHNSILKINISTMSAPIKRTVIVTSNAPTPGGPYSQAIKIDNMMYMSGQVGRDPVSGKLVSGGIEPETKQVLENMCAVLKAAGATMNNVVKTTVLLDNMDDFGKMNAIYETYFTGPAKPARACYQVAKLPLGCKLEIEAVAALGEIQEV